MKVINNFKEIDFVIFFWSENLALQGGKDVNSGLMDCEFELLKIFGQILAIFLKL